MIKVSAAPNTATPSLQFPESDTAPAAQQPLSLEGVPLYQCSAGGSTRGHYYRTYFYSDKIVRHYEGLELSKRSEKQRDSEKNLSRGEYNGFISPKSRGKLRRFLEAWLQSAAAYREHKKERYETPRCYITFATVTLPLEQAHSDNEIKRKVLVPFIEKLQRIYGVENYFWRAEPQMNGNIHFHILLDRYIDNKWLQNEWNVSTDKLDYLTNYYLETGSLFPPTTHIMKVPKGSNVVSYMLKYALKSPKKIPVIKPGKKERYVSKRFVGERKEEKEGSMFYEWRKIGGRVWGCCDAIRRMKVFNSEETFRQRNLFDKVVIHENVKHVKDDYWEVVYCDTQAMLKKYDAVLYAQSLWYYLAEFDRLYMEDSSEKRITKPPEPERKKEREKEEIQLDLLEELELVEIAKPHHGSHS